ncbi:MAG: hypothetical protein ACFWUD_04765 [Thermocaproicibacter melissae]|jgi:DNA repair ATPase RecN|uniref:flagellar protein FlgN n=1 Tax=Thermocaproicibacter melissae TaxID=2966552 RepID=UPI0024B125F8|nr:flagellar protein FlgN [Thermocaproicibacter melissae]WBY64311.1 flagellar protein FlgN [Thermocaproicibacter melissae]
MIAAEQADELIRFFKRMLAFYREFLAFEREKYEIIVSGNFQKLDASLKREQAFTLKARGFEKDRVKLLEKLGCTQATFRQLIEEVDPTRKEAMQKLYEDLSATVSDVKAVNERSAGMLRAKMNRVSKILSRMENQPELKKIYGNHLGERLGHETTFSKKV